MNAFALSGRIYGGRPTQGDALGYALVAPSLSALNLVSKRQQSAKLELVIKRY